MENLTILPVQDIPQEVVDCPTDNLLQVFSTCLQMAQLCIKEHGIGLSAVQVGIPWRLFVVRYNEKFRFFLNAHYVPVSDEKVKSLEGCLSLKNEEGKLRHYQVDRYKNIKVEGLELCTNPNLQLESVRFEPIDFYNYVFQHEIDHEMGILISDIGVEFEVWE